jgi:hypothetical protein
MFGYLKGAAINANQLFHLTGFGDYAVSNIDILKNPFEENKSKMWDINGVHLSQSPINPQRVELFAESSSNKIVEKLVHLNENEEMIIEEANQKEEEKQNTMIEEEEEKIEEKPDNQSDLSYEENEAQLINIEEEKSLKH